MDLRVDYEGSRVVFVVVVFSTGLWTLVPKKHWDKFRTIFHHSFPKTGESINSFIEKD